MREAAAMTRSIAVPLALALLAGSPAYAGVDGAAAATGVPAAKPVRNTFTPTQLSNYAAALVDIEVAGEAVAAQEASLPTEQREAIDRQAQSGTKMIVQRNDLDPATFNAISRAVESDPTLRLKVHQAMMDKVVGT